MSGEPGALRITLDDGTTVEADTLLVAVGRRPNGDRMDLDAAGVDVDDAGRIVVDAHQRTTADGVWALGDVCTPVPLKHVANREADVVRHNLRQPGRPVSAGHDLVPSAIFTHPQIAAIGATEQELRDRGVDYRVGLARTGTPPTGGRWRTRRGSARCSSIRPTPSILGAHIMGPQAPTLVQPLVLAATLGITARRWSSGPTGSTPRSPKSCNRHLSKPSRDFPHKQFRPGHWPRPEWSTAGPSTDAPHEPAPSRVGPHELRPARTIRAEPGRAVESRYKRAARSMASGMQQHVVAPTVNPVRRW